MKVIVLFEKPITPAFHKILFCFSTINVFLFIGKNVSIIGIKLPIINTFLPIDNKKIDSRETKKVFFGKLELCSF